MPDITGNFDFPPVRDLLDRMGVRLSRHKSQHFLQNPVWCERIAELCKLTKHHAVVEVGTGLGNLTVELAKRAGDVHSIEMDDAFKEWHRELMTCFSNLFIHRQDFLKSDLNTFFPDVSRPKVACGNLPYQITAPILFKLIECDHAWERIVIMVQREVAERIAAGPATRRASALTYKIALEYEADIACRLGPREFIPPPRVDSAVVVLRPLPERLVKSREHKQRVYNIISGVFQHRRRTISNGLVLGGIVPSRDIAQAALGKAGIDFTDRPENLAIPEFLRLADAVAEVMA